MSPTITTKPPLKAWLLPAWQRFLARQQPPGAWVMAKIRPGAHWWDLDDVLLAHCRPDVVLISRWRLVRRSTVEAAADALGDDAHRLEVREITT